MTRTSQHAAQTAVATGAPANRPKTDATSVRTPRSTFARDILARTVAFVVLAAASTALMALPYVAGGSQAAEDKLSYSQRLDEAFRLAEANAFDQALFDSLSVAASKADRLAVSGCAAQTWPHIDPRCLVGAEAGARPPVRTVTVEYRTGDSSSALVRMPIQQLASQ